MFVVSRLRTSQSTDRRMRRASYRATIAVRIGKAAPRAILDVAMRFRSFDCMEYPPGPLAERLRLAALKFSVSPFSAGLDLGGQAQATGEHVAPDQHGWRAPRAESADSRRPSNLLRLAPAK